MSEKRFFDIWAWSQIEAAADGSLDGESVQRMAEAQDRDARLRAAVARARTVHAALRASGNERPPRGLLGVLLAIPRRHPRARSASAARVPWRSPVWTTAGGAVAAASLVAIVVAGLSEAPVAPPPEPALAAVQDFEVALAYLSKSAAVTGREVGAALNGGITAALEVSRDSLSRRPD